MSDWHRAGRKIVCIDSFTASAKLGETVPQLDKIYTIREVTLIRGLVFFRLDEIVNSPCDYLEGNGEAAFEGRGFRPVVIPEADIAQFEAILRGVEKRVNHREPVEV